MQKNGSNDLNLHMHFVPEILIFQYLKHKHQKRLHMPSK